MGVRGLTSFVGRNAEQFLKPHELHDTKLVIDGDSLACNLYKDVSNCNSAFGGDYDEFYRTVVSFFHILSECKIIPFVLLDGGYESKKMKTVQQRMRNKICIIKHLNPGNCKPMFPLMMREVFVEACKDCNVHIMRCLFEADDELAALAKKLNCPLLSYDSDFYIHNVKYIPLITLTMKVLEKKETKFSQRTTLRYCEAKKLKKRKEINSGQGIICLDTLKTDKVDKSIDQNENVGQIENIPTKIKKPKTSKKNVKYLDCCIYRIENLLQKKKMSKDKLPLFAALLGNDYIPTSCFKNFYSQVGMRGIARKKIPRQQKRVMAILKWLSHETLESATEKIMTRIKKEHREILENRMKTATDGYMAEESDAFEFFNLNENDYKSDSDKNIDSFSDCSSENDSVVDYVNDDDENSDENSYQNSDGNSDEISSELGGSEAQIEDIENCDEKAEGADFENEDKNQNENDFHSNESNEKNREEDTHPAQNKNNFIKAKDRIPILIQKRIFTGNLPRFISDLFYSNLYINSPQIENFLNADANEISLPILLQNFALLMHPLEIPELRYLTRVIRVTNVIYRRIEVPAFNNYLNFELSEPNMGPMKECFSKLPGIECEVLFEKLLEIPKDLQLYFLAILYWFSKSKTSNSIHIKCLLICLCVLRTCDSKIEPIRCEKKFKKTFGKILQKEKLQRSKIQTTSENINDNKKTNKNLLKVLNPFEKISFISKTECLLVQENILKYFHFNENNRNKHTEFSSSVLHSYAEFQCVCLQLFTLNRLSNLPLENFKLSQLYNGVFLYNIYESLKQRPDVTHYIKNYLLKDSDIIFDFYAGLENWLGSFLPCLKNSQTSTSTSTLNKKVLKKLKKIQNKDKLKSEVASIERKFEIIKQQQSDGVDDLNNRFNILANDI